MRAYHAGLFNIGVEGQAYIGGLGVGIICLTLGEYAPWYVVFPVAVIAGGILVQLGRLFLLTYRQTGSHIVITTIMFNFIAASLMAYLLVDILKPETTMATESRVFAQVAGYQKCTNCLVVFGINVAKAHQHQFYFRLLCQCVQVVIHLAPRWGYEIRLLETRECVSCILRSKLPKI